MDTINKNISVFLSLSETDKPLISFANYLAQKTGSAVRLVHNIDPKTIKGSISILEEQKVISAIETKIESYKELINPSIDTEIAVLKGKMPDALIYNAVSNQSDFILCSSLFHSYIFFPENISATVKILKESPIPLINVGQHSNFTGATTKYKIVVFDDFSVDAQRALQKSSILASTLENCEINQVHITSDNELSFLDSLVTEDIHRNSLDVKFHRGNETQHLNIYKALFLNNKNSNQLKTPYPPSSDRKYIVHTGKAAKEIENIKESLNPDMVVFGKHHLFHKKEFQLGSVNYSQMLDEHMITLIT